MFWGPCLKTVRQGCVTEVSKARDLAHSRASQWSASVWPVSVNFLCLSSDYITCSSDFPVPSGKPHGMHSSQICKICFFLPSSFPSSNLTLLYTPASLSQGFINFPRNSTGQNAGMGSLSFLQGIFPTQGSNPGLPHCRWILYQLSHQGTPRILGWVAYPFSSRSSRPRNQTWVSCIAGRFFNQLTYQGSPSFPRLYTRCFSWDVLFFLLMYNLINFYSICRTQFRCYGLGP